ILLHLTDHYANAENHIGPKIGDDKRDEFTRWLIWMGGTLHPYFGLHFKPNTFTTDESAIASVQAASHIMIVCHIIYS
ncbi:MAG: hypothetical protein HRU38_19175, partial [Saccharospirillaceae bacterium]|nr:hypothetical protein [Pseudomonadales bacterium]NRB80758.1 hypothetical protein [Saccharospirillaceae bacterium]